MKVTDIVYMGGGLIAAFDDGSVANAQYYVNRSTGKLELLGITPAQAAALDEFKQNNIGDTHDPRFSRDVGSGPTGVIETTSITLSFSNEQYKNFIINTQFVNPTLIMGRMYINADPGAEFIQPARLMFYNHPSCMDDQAICVIGSYLVCTDVIVDALSGDTLIVVADTSEFMNDDLIYIHHIKNEFRRILSIADNTLYLMNVLINDYDASSSVSNVPEFSGMTLYDSTNNKKIYGKLMFDTNQTVSVKIDLALKS